MLIPAFKLLLFVLSQSEMTATSHIKEAGTNQQMFDILA